MLTHAEAARLLATARDPFAGKPLENNTRLYARSDGYAVRLHSTDVVTIHADGTYTLATGGWETMTTRRRISDYAPVVAFGKGGRTMIRNEAPGADPFRDAFPVFDGMRVDAVGSPLDDVRTIARIDRERSSRNGNPRYRLTFTDGTHALTAVDASYGYQVGNPGHRVGDTVALTLTGRGTISYARSVRRGAGR